MSRSRPTVSVIIAAHNEAAYIDSVLRSVFAQTYAPVEVVVVDDGSSDATPEVATSHPVKLIRQSHAGAGAARNRGARTAAGDILVFVDGDMILAETFLEALIAPMVDDGAPGTFTKEIRVANGARRWARAHMIGRGLPPDQHFPAGFPDRWENYRGVWRDLFLKVGGFDEVGHGEDVTLGRKLEQDAHAAPGAECWHYEPDTLPEIFRSARWYGRGERIRELERPARLHGPVTALRRGFALARRHGMPSLICYRFVWDSGVLVGWLTRDRAGAAK